MNTAEPVWAKEITDSQLRAVSEAFGLTTGRKKRMTLINQCIRRVKGDIKKLDREYLEVKCKDILDGGKSMTKTKLTDDDLINCMITNLMQKRKCFRPKVKGKSCPRGYSFNDATKECCPNKLLNSIKDIAGIKRSVKDKTLEDAVTTVAKKSSKKDSRILLELVSLFYVEFKRELEHFVKKVAFVFGNKTDEEIMEIAKTDTWWREAFKNFVNLGVVVGQKAWGATKWVGSKIAKASLPVIKYILSSGWEFTKFVINNPQVAAAVTLLAAELKDHICRELAIRFGRYRIKDGWGFSNPFTPGKSSKRYTNAFISSVVHEIVEGGALEDILGDLNTFLAPVGTSVGEFVKVAVPYVGGLLVGGVSGFIGILKGSVGAIITRAFKKVVKLWLVKYDLENTWSNIADIFDLSQCFKEVELTIAEAKDRELNYSDLVDRMGSYM